MTPLLRYFSWRYMRCHPIRVLLNIFSIALGVAIYVSVDISNTSAEAAFRKTVDRLSGHAQLQVSRGRTLGADDETLAKVEAVPGVKAAPVLQLGTTAKPSGESLLVLGLDFRREASFGRLEARGQQKPRAYPFAFLMRDWAVVPESFAARQKLKPGSTFGIDTPEGPRALVAAAIVPDEGAAQAFGGNIVVMDVRTAQRLFRREGRFDRIEVRVDGDVNAAAERIRAALGPEYSVHPPPRQNSFLDEALTRIQALLGVSVIALLVGVFIIYNSVAISVAERIREIGTLRSIGATRGQIFRLILAEWSLLGAIGSGMGVGLGAALARVLLRMTAGEVNQLTLVVDVGEITVLPRTILLGLGMGTLTAFIAAFFPGRKAMSVSPVRMLREGVIEVRSSSSYRPWFIAGVVSILLSALPIVKVIWFENAALVSAFVAFLGAALVLPQLTLWASRLARPVLGRCFRLGGVLAADNLGSAPRRTALTVIALSGALAMMVASSAIILSFRVRGDVWLDDLMPFDCTVTSTDFTATLYADARLPENLPSVVRSVEGVDFVYPVREALQDYGEHDIRIFAIETQGYVRAQTGHGGRGFVQPAIESDFSSGKGVVVTDNFAGLHALKVGDPIELRTRKGPKSFKILGTYEDYSWPLGTVYMDLAAYRASWEDPAISYVDVKFKPGAARDEVRKRVADRVKDGYSLFVYDVEDFRRIGDETLDRTLAFTNVQVAVTAVIGFLGFVNTLLISVLGRTREIGLLRAVGMTRGQVGGMIVIEAMFISLVGGLLGVTLGLVAAKWPLSLHVFEISGYRMPLAIPWSWIALALATALVTGILASILPARRAAAVNVLDAITYE